MAAASICSVGSHVCCGWAAVGLLVVAPQCDARVRRLSDLRDAVQAVARKCEQLRGVLEEEADMQVRRTLHHT